MPKANPSHTLALPLVFSILDSLSLLFHSLPKQKPAVILIPVTLSVTYCRQVLLIYFPAYLVPGSSSFWFRPSASLTQTTATAPFTSFLASDFGFIHLYITVFPYVTLAVIFPACIWWCLSAPHLLPKVNLNPLEQTQAYKVVSMSDLTFLLSSSHSTLSLLWFSFMFSHISASF